MIVIDGVFFQINRTGIARVWTSWLQRWAWTDFARRIVVLDRGGTMPRLEGISQLTIPRHDYRAMEQDREMLQRVCDHLEARCFVSTYYSSPAKTPSVFVCHDMIPELLGFNLSDPMWQEKHHAIRRASAIVSVSHNSMADLERLFPEVLGLPRCVAHNGVSFNPQAPKEVTGFRHRHGIEKPYFLLVGARDHYKNALLFFRAVRLLEAGEEGFSVVCCGGAPVLEEAFRALAPGLQVHMLNLDEHELQCAYSGAIALAYPSLYEGFGMPVAEAMACGCPVVTTALGSLPEVAGEAALFVDPGDVKGMADALAALNNDLSTREILIRKGLERASRFSWDRSAESVREFLLDRSA